MKKTITLILLLISMVGYSQTEVRIDSATLIHPITKVELQTVKTYPDFYKAMFELSRIYDLDEIISESYYSDGNIIRVTVVLRKPRRVKRNTL